MNIKEKLIILKTKLKTCQNKQAKIYDLNGKVDEFLNWYKIGQERNEMRNFLEKMAVWYELRYPDYEVNKLISLTLKDDNNYDLLNNNPYLKNSLPNYDWPNFYNTKAFLNSLSESEKKYFAKPIYPKIVYWNRLTSTAHLSLTPSGYVIDSELMTTVNPYIKDEFLIGKHLKDVIKIFKRQGVCFPLNNELEKAVNYINKMEYQKQEMLNCVMYRLIERDKEKYGPRRAFLFAKEFHLNLDIPMIYGINLNDMGLSIFIKEYLKEGGKLNLNCLVNDNFTTMPLKEILEKSLLKTSQNLEKVIHL